MKAAVSRMQLRRLSETLYAHRLIIIFALIGLAALITVSWFVRLAGSSLYRVQGPVPMDAYGLAGVEMTVVYPTRLSVEQTDAEPARITAYARALSPEAVRSYELVLSLPDHATGFVDAAGSYTPGRLTITPGYPDMAPYDLRIAHRNTPLRGQLLRPYWVRVLPMLRTDRGYTSVPELAFRVALESRFIYAARAFAVAASNVGMPYFVIGLIVLTALLAWQRLQRWRHVARERQLADTYLQLREDIRLERWADARRRLEQISSVYPRYRDIEHLDVLVGKAETVAWRREQLYGGGVRAYRGRNWSEAVQYLSELESETPYFRDVPFLRRTAALYADLGSRDRSRRAAAARELGEVADLLDASPLVRALGDKSAQVADAAEAALRVIGPDALDVLLGGLIHESPAVRERSQRLIEGFGHEARDRLIGALRSSEPRITRQVAPLLARLGARKELAEALLWVGPEHQEAIVAALLNEGAASCDVLVQALFKAPPDRQQTLVNALAALKDEEDLDRHLHNLLRTNKDAERKELLQRVLKASPTTFYAPSEAPQARYAEEEPPVEEERPPEEKRRPPRLKLLDRLRS